jgi:hypothetical protein
VGLQYCDAQDYLYLRVIVQGRLFLRLHLGDPLHEVLMVDDLLRDPPCPMMRSKAICPARCAEIHCVCASKSGRSLTASLRRASMPASTHTAFSWAPLKSSVPMYHNQSSQRQSIVHEFRQRAPAQSPAPAGSCGIAFGCYVTGPSGQTFERSGAILIDARARWYSARAPQS